METHGENPLKNAIAIIPARLGSSRLPGKLLLDLAGKPMILRTLEQAKKARLVSRVLVATDDRKIFDAVEKSGNEAVMTSSKHRTGSDRIAEVAEELNADAVIVNVQGDEPMISPGTIDLAIAPMFESDEADISTTCEIIDDPEDVLNPDVVKVVTDDRGFAIYFSRAPIPFPRTAARRHGDLGKALLEEPGLVSTFRKHTGLYVYRGAALRRFCMAAQAEAELVEILEQLRAIDCGLKIRVVETAERTIGVDTEEDLENVRKILSAGEQVAV